METKALNGLLDNKILIFDETFGSFSSGANVDF